MTTHELKVRPPYFQHLADGSKTFEVRRNDRGYQAGDTLRLREWQGLPVPGYTGRSIERTVTYVQSLDPDIGGIEPGFVVLGLSNDLPERIAAAIEAQAEHDAHAIVAEWAEPYDVAMRRAARVAREWEVGAR